MSRELSLFQITMMGLGMMIGAGVFLGMGISISQAGPGGVVLTSAFNGLLAVFTATSFAELSSAIPRSVSENLAKSDEPAHHPFGRHYQ